MFVGTPKRCEFLSLRRESAGFQEEGIGCPVLCASVILAGIGVALSSKV